MPAPGIQQILLEQKHRPWPMPAGAWRYYQEWNKALFLHWPVAVNILRPLVPATLQLDTLNGQCWVSLVAFKMEQIRPRYLPAVSLVSNFAEVNVRTYVVHGGKTGVYFLSIEAAKRLSAALAKSLSALPYQYSPIQFGDDAIKAYSNQNTHTGNKMDARFTVKQTITNKSAADSWLTERYCLYNNTNSNLYRYHIHHLPWQLNRIDLNTCNTRYNIGGIELNTAPALAHYSPGVKVVAWGSERVL